MKKVNILTVHCAVNHGAVLQAYALSRAVSRLGYAASIVDYRPSKVVRQYLHFGHPLSWAKRGAQYLIFSTFQRVRMPLTRRVYRVPIDFQRHPLRADILLCGSDQIWNTKIFKGVDPAYFLNIPCGGARRVAYAVSMGNHPFPREHVEEAGRAISRFQSVSAREPFTAHQARAAGFTRRIPITLDPTLLVEDYTPLMPPGEFRDPYIAAYFVLRDDEFNSAALKLKQTLRLPLVNISTARLKGADRNACLIDPGEWLKYIRDSAFVITNSFHGTVFAVLFDKAFYSLRLHGRHAGQESRSKELLDSLSLGSRLISTSEDIPAAPVDIPRIDYTPARRLLDEKRKESLSVLATALNSGQTPVCEGRRTMDEGRFK